MREQYSTLRPRVVSHRTVCDNSGPWLLDAVVPPRLSTHTAMWVLSGALHDREAESRDLKAMASQLGGVGSVQSRGIEDRRRTLR